MFYDSEIDRSHNKSSMQDENYNYNQLELDKVAHLSSFISRNTVVKSRRTHQCIIFIAKHNKRGDDAVDSRKE